MREILRDYNYTPCKFSCHFNMCMKVAQWSRTAMQDFHLYIQCNFYQQQECRS